MVRLGQYMGPLLPNTIKSKGKSVLDTYYGGWKFFRPNDIRELDPEAWEEIGQLQ